ncbi:MAG: hypothetical protein AAGJ35_11615, partial [Myxococcota bacterium]
TEQDAQNTTPFFEKVTTVLLQERDEPHQDTLITTYEQIDEEKEPELLAEASPIPSIRSLPSEPLSRLPQEPVWLQQIPAALQTQDADPAFEEIVDALGSDELQIVEVLSTLKRSFWSPLKTLISSCNPHGIFPFATSLHIQSIQNSAQSTTTELVHSIVSIYSQKLEDISQIHALHEEVKQRYHLGEKRRERLFGDIQTPFREYTERLEALILVHQQFLTWMEEHEELLLQTKALLAPSLIDTLLLVEEPSGIEMAWKMWLEALKQAKQDQHLRNVKLYEQWTLCIEQFIVQFEPTYTAILHRILEVWMDKLLPPLKALAQY